jgi:DNA-binding GntR family transcriptional regulator
VYEAIRDEIVSGVLRPGDRLGEVELAKRMGTSQGPVREALARLRSQGLVDAYPHRGTFVAELTIEEARDVYETRALIERRALALALPLLREDDYALLELDIEAMKRAARAKDMVQLVAADMGFHRRVVAASGSPTLLRFWDLIEAKTRKFAATYSLTVFADPLEPVESHHRLIQRMREGYGPGLEQELDLHLGAIWASGELEALARERRA